VSAANRFGEFRQLVRVPPGEIAQLDPRQAPELLNYAAFGTLPIN
jgi:hypothetical protein